MHALYKAMIVKMPGENEEGIVGDEGNQNQLPAEGNLRCSAFTPITSK